MNKEGRTTHYPGVCQPFAGRNFAQLAKCYTLNALEEHKEAFLSGF